MKQDRGWWEHTACLTAEHIRDGKPRSCKGCAVALAVSEAIGSWRFVDVAIDGRIIVRDDNGRHVEAHTEQRKLIRSIVKSFDNGLANQIQPVQLRFKCPFPPLRSLD